MMENLLFCLIKDKISHKLANAIINRYEPKKVFLMIDRTFASDASICGATISQKYIYQECQNLKYWKYKYSDSSPPPDNKLLTKLLVHEPIIFKMFDRYPNETSKSTKKTLMTYDERVRAYHTHLQYWSYMLDRAKISTVVFANAPHTIVDYIIYCLCLLKGIDVVMSSNAFNPSFVAFHSVLTEPCPRVAYRYEKLLIKYKDTHIDNIELDSDFLNVFNNLSSQDENKTPWFMNPELAILKKREGYIPPLIVAYNAKAVNPDFSKRYIYFPLHFQPELTTCPLGGYFVHQTLAIKMISHCLPRDMFLYVKEHPNQDAKYWGRNLSDYSDIGKLQNVSMVKQDVDTFELIKNCIAVATITGTAGFEGLFMSKPFLMFGNHTYKYASGVYNIRTNKECREAITIIATNGAEHTLKDLKIWLKAVSKDVSFCTVHFPQLMERGILPISEVENMNRVTSGYFRVLDEFEIKNNVRTPSVPNKNRRGKIRNFLKRLLRRSKH